MRKCQKLISESRIRGNPKPGKLVWSKVPSRFETPKKLPQWKRHVNGYWRNLQGLFFKPEFRVIIRFEASTEKRKLY
jgi:hypothetical protein